VNRGFLEDVGWVGGLTVTGIIIVGIYLSYCKELGYFLPYYKGHRYKWYIGIEYKVKKIPKA
jgi:hypothetical protein